jgi:putative transcriptional regulator
MIGVSVATLRHWEQGRRTPKARALALLRIAVHNPPAVAEALHRMPRKGAQLVLFDITENC